LIFAVAYFLLVHFSWIPGDKYITFLLHWPGYFKSFPLVVYMLKMKELLKTSDKLILLLFYFSFLVLSLCWTDGE
jgi:hypothetical protein